jgi:long-chain acyl-CoA synthetase
LPPARFAVSIYQTNSAEECHYVLNHSGARAVFVEDAEQLAKVRAVQADLPALEFVVVIESRGRGRQYGLARCAARAGARAVGPRPSSRSASTASGRTRRACWFTRRARPGPPKACELTHGNYRAITSAVETQDIVREDECVYLFLPLAHALALVIQFLVLDVGATIAYWKKDPQKIVANLIELKPTFFRR